MQNFKLSTVQVKFHQICTLIGFFCRKHIKFQLKKYRGFMSHDTEEWMQNLKKKNVVSKMIRIWWILIRALKSLKNFYFDWSLLWKVYNFWPKKVQSSYHSWHWKVMQNLKKNCFVVWKMTWEIWQIFTRTLASVKIGTLMGSFCQSRRIHTGALKIYRGFMCNDTEKW